MKRVALILSGCGVQDGSEIHESVLSLFYLDTLGATVTVLAPNISQSTVVNHLTGNTLSEKRNVLEESARIARGKIKDLATAHPNDFDAAIIPGGFGAAKNLCSFAEKGKAFEIEHSLDAFLKGMAKAQKPVGFICIAPVMIPKIYPKGVKLTIGNDRETAAVITAMGGQHIECAVNEIAIDEAHKVVSTPAYMLANSIKEAASGIEKCIQKVLELA